MVISLAPLHTHMEFVAKSASGQDGGHRSQRAPTTIYEVYHRRAHHHSYGPTPLKYCKVIWF